MAGNVTTNLSNFVPEVVADAVEAGFAGMTALWGTGAAVVNTQMPYGLDHLDTKVKIPYFDLIGELEDVPVDGGELSPAEVTSSIEEATVKHSGKGIEFTKWAMLNPTNPYAEGTRQIIEATQRRADKALIDAAADTTGWAAYTKDVYSSVTPVYMSYDLITDGMSLLGDEGFNEPPVLMLVHSDTAIDMYKEKDATGRPMLVEGGPGRLAVLQPLGIPVAISDRAPFNSTTHKYQSMLVWRGSLTFWLNGTPIIMPEVNARKPSFADYLHIYHATHRYKHRSRRSKPGVTHLFHNVKKYG